MLGAGFSRAISEHMPLTNELGEAVNMTLRRKSDHDSGESFEEQLTVLSTPMPFLQGHENTARLAQAQAITAGIASEMDGRQARAVADPPPAWLLQLVAVWHSEQAVVITFNYDSLVEHAVGSLRPIVVEPGGQMAWPLNGNQVVYPAPVAAGARTIAETSPADNRSFQLLKLHGSLTWYWSAGDSASMSRDPSDIAFERTQQAWDVAGLGTLDRFLIPPVLSKDSYYNINIAHILWRTARAAVVDASQLAILGYSLPAGDRITAELLRGTRDDIPVHIVNRDVGSTDDVISPLGRSVALGLHATGVFGGGSAVEDYVQACVSRLTAGLTTMVEARGDDEDAVLATIYLPGADDPVKTFVIAQVEEDYVGWPITRYSAAYSDIPPLDFAFNALGRMTPARESLCTRRMLADFVADGGVFRVEVGGMAFVAVGAREADLGRWHVVDLILAPNPDGKL